MILCGWASLPTLKSFENTVGKADIACPAICPFPGVFYPFGELPAIFIIIQNCRLQSLSVFERLKYVI